MFEKFDIVSYHDTRKKNAKNFNMCFDCDMAFNKKRNAYTTNPLLTPSYCR